MEWKKKTKEKFAEGASEKQQVAQMKERKRLDLLDDLKEAAGPFTNAVEVQNYVERNDINDKIKQVRMKKEVQFARESSTTLPSTDPLFKIQITMPSGKRRDKTAFEFAEALMVFLGKKSESNVMNYNVFKSSLRKFAGDGDTNNN